jgi:hypothetical protein
MTFLNIVAREDEDDNDYDLVIIYYSSLSS